MVYGASLLRLFCTSNTKFRSLGDACERPYTKVQIRSQRSSSPAPAEVIAMNEKLPWRNIIGYSLGDVANNFAFAMGALFLLSYYTDVAGVGAAAAGAVLLGVRIFDAFADVFAGRVVDSVSTRWGKFRPFLIFASIPLMILSVLVFCVPESWGHGAKVAYALVTYALLGLFYSLVNIPYGSLATAMTQEPVSRTRLGAARGIGASLTFVMLAFVIAPNISGVEISEAQHVYMLATSCLAVIGYCLYVLCFKSTKENVVRTVAQPSFKESVHTVKQNKPLMMLCCAALFMLAASFSISASAIFYVRYVVGDASYFSIMVLIQNLIGGVVIAPFVPGLVRRLGKKKTFLTGCAVAFVGFMAFYFLTAVNFYVAMVGLTIASIGLGISMTVTWALEADTVEYGEYKTGIRIEGLTYSLFSLTRKCGQALGGSIPAFILGLCGYVANQDQTPEVIHGIRMAIALIPAIAIACSFLVMFFYPLTDTYFKNMLQEIVSRRAQKAADEAGSGTADIHAAMEDAEQKVATATTTTTTAANTAASTTESAK